jgi:hypothetical protein
MQAFTRTRTHILLHILSLCRNLLKGVFATGTLAAGINMPARTTVISALGRMTDDGPQLMPHNELLQVIMMYGKEQFGEASSYLVISALGRVTDGVP